METQVLVVPPHGRLGPDASRLAEHLKDGQPGDTVTDETLAAICGKPTGCNGDGYGWLLNAMSYLAGRAENPVVWHRVRGAGAIQCQGADGIIDLADSDRKSIRRKSHRTLKRFCAVKSGDIPEHRRKEFTALVAAHRVLEHFSKSNTIKKLVARNLQPQPDMAKLLEAVVSNE